MIYCLFFLSLVINGFPGMESLFGFQQFPDTPIGHVEKLMAYNRFWDAYTECKNLIQQKGKKAEPKLYRLKAQCELTMSMSNDAIETASEIINRKKVDTQERQLCYQIRAKAYMQNGQFTDAEADAERSRDPKTKRDAINLLTIYREYTNKLDAQEYNDAANALDKILQVATNRNDLKYKRAELAWNANDYDKFESLAEELIKVPEYQPDNELFYRLAIVSLCGNKIEISRNRINEAIKKNSKIPEYKTARDTIQDIRKEMSQARRYQQQENLQALNNSIEKLIPMSMKYCKFQSNLLKEINLIKAKYIRKLGDNQKTLDFLNHMISNYSSTGEFEIERAEISLEEGDFDSAIFDFQSAQRSGINDRRVREGLNKAQQLKKEKTTVDYYKILGVTRSASQQEIKTAFRKATIKWHPDRHRDPEAKKNAEAMMKKINVAYEVLSDPQKKNMYDQGVDPEHPEMGGTNFGDPFGDFDPFGDILNAFGFGGFGGFGGGGNFRRVQFQNGQGFQFQFNF